MAQDAIVTIKLSLTRTNLMLSVLNEEQERCEERSRQLTGAGTGGERRALATRAAELKEIIDLIGGK